MNVSEISIRRPVFAWMLMVGLILFGAISFMRMGVSQLPDVDFPVISISVNYDGAAPEVVETSVLDLLEDSVMTIEGVKSISSTAKTGSGSISIELNLERNIDLALQDVQSKVAQAQRRLPREVEAPIVTKTNPEDQPILWLSFANDQMSQSELMTYVRNHLKDQFSTIPGVGDVFLGGYVDPNLRVWVDEKKLNQYQLTVSDVIHSIESEHSEPPSGRIETPQRELNVRTLGEATSVKDFERIQIQSRGGQPNYLPTRLKDVAQVEEGLDDVRRISRVKGKPSIGLGVRKQRGSNAVAVAKAVKAKMELLKSTLPPGSDLGVNFDSTHYIEESVSELNFTLILSALLTAIVCWWFVGSLSSTINVILAIPTSIFGTFIVLNFAGFTLNTFTLLALTLAIGIVVDDAIMVLENIIRHREMGKTREQAALDGAREITFAALVATISIAAIFLPVAFMKGIIGKFFFQFGVTMTAAVLLSLVEALTLTPMRCAQFVEPPHRTTRFGKAIERWLGQLREVYTRLLAWSLGHRLLVLGTAIVIFSASLFSVKWINKEFVPAEDQGNFMVRMQTVIGSSLGFTDVKFREAEKVLDAIPDIQRYFVSVGGFGGGDVNAGIAFLTLKPKNKRDKSQQDVMDLVRTELSKIPGVKVSVQDLSMRSLGGSGRGYPIEFSLRGPDWNQLGKLTTDLMDKLNKQGKVTDLDTDYKIGMPELQILPDRERAAAHGVSVATITEAINALVSGVLVGQYPKGGRRYDIRVKMKDPSLEQNQGKKIGKQDLAQQIERIKSIHVRNNRGEVIRLSDLVRIEEKSSLQSITRQDRARAISIFGNLAKGVSQATALDEIQAMGKSLPKDYEIVLGGGSQGMGEAFQSLVFALWLGLLVSYMVLASQFNSWLHPITVLTALPFSLTGAFLSLLITRQSLNMYSLIGIILLMGIVKKNSILLVDFTNQLRAEGKTKMDALMHACPDRLRPILMTTGRGSSLLFADCSRKEGQSA